MEDKYLFSIEVDPYDPNRQLSIINGNGGEPKFHFSTDEYRGVLVVKIDFRNMDNLERKYDWIRDVHKGYYRFLKRARYS